ncbi:MAG: Crp/Fnr family transcriptional regulator [Bernardetiaceae bacterium]|nr:Crp/Fnr family transcriptional regulator [Bernardetiaceae bacterium]
MSVGYMQQLKATFAQIAPLTEATWQAVEALFRLKTLPKHDFFAQAGRLERQIGFVGQGVLRAFYRNGQGKDYNKTFFVPGDFVGAFSALVSGRPNQIYLQALTDCTIWVADYPRFTALFDTRPDLERLARRYAEWLFVEKEQREIELVLLNAEQRYHKFKATYPSLEQQIAQHHIASYLGVTPTHGLSYIAKKHQPR